ncbi:hypothetical protein Clacol_008810 [Clathrus columnatus]|uniref:Uncharacterized protein n=1 Tax=Clathrus columnatus TaxID=1419009 RepID=A0AAV5ARM9_9AGAM|nr:hypothetical protein Clacol_008810 [Clathrus columnatus]
MSSQSVIQIYICAGYAKYFYTVDILNWICLDRLWITGGDPVPQGFQFRHFKMAENRMHRLFLPFNCAMKLCDLVQDDILAGPIADYLAKKAVTYGTEPVLLKYAQDLEDIWNKLTKDILGLIDNLHHNLLSNLQESGKLVSKYRRPAQITKDSIKNTRIMDTLEATALADWGTDTDEIQEYAAAIADDFITICDSTASEPEEHDEYFEQDGKRILFSQI